MTNLKLLKILNPILALGFLAAAFGIIFLNYIHLGFLPENIMFKIHVTGGLTVLIIGIIHLTLNWKWVKMNIFGIKPKSKAAPTATPKKK
jgi:hypothetical protein